MRIRTIHRNKLGNVYNECSAHGFEITTGDGTRITVMVDAAQTQPKRRRYDPYGSLSEYGIFPECDAQPLEAPSETVNVAGMREFDSLLDHIYEYGTKAEGVVERANALARAVLARYAPQQPVTVDEAAAQRLADAVKADLGWSHLSPQARVEKARRYLAIAAQQQEARNG